MNSNSQYLRVPSRQVCSIQSKNVLYRQLAAITICIILGVAAPLAIISTTTNAHINEGSIGALTVLIVATIRLFRMVQTGRITPLAMSFWIFIYFWMGLAAFAQTVSNKYFWPGDYSVTLQVEGVGIVLLALVAYEVGRYLARRFHHSRYTTSALITPRRVYILSVLAIITSSYAVDSLGGITHVVVTRMEWGRYLFSSSTFTNKNALILMTLLRVPPFVAMLAAWHLWLNRGVVLLSKRKRVVLLFLLVILGVLNLVANFPLALGRYWLGSLAIAILFVSTKKTRNTVAHWILGLTLILLIIFPLAAQTRYMRSLEDIGSIRFVNPINHFYDGDYDAFQQVLNTVRYVKVNGVSWGNNLEGAALFWVPRSMWTEKPLPTGQIIAQWLGYSYTDLSEPLWGEGYFAFGYLGVFLLLLSYGYMSAALDKVYESNNELNKLTYILIPFWMGYQFLFLRGDLMNGLAYGIPVIVIMYLAFGRRVRLTNNKSVR